MSLKQGDPIPEFSLENHKGKVFQSAEIHNGKPVVIFFYPKNFTPGCTAEACSFRDNYRDFEDAGAVVLGISSDSQASHQRFTEKYNLPYTLLADTQGKVRKQFGVKGELLGLIPGRETFVFDNKGKLLLRFNSLKASGHIKKALKAVKSI
ncbi:MAG: peroxiredoxin [Leeuwenhoekiella sp.]